jgi:hypothetical protein
VHINEAERVLKGQITAGLGDADLSPVSSHRDTTDAEGQKVDKGKPARLLEGGPGDP